MNNYSGAARYARAAVLMSYFGLLAALALATLVWPSGGREPNPVIWALSSIPLLILLPGVVHGSLRSHAWLCFVTLLYFVMAVPNLAVPGGQWLDAAELICAVVLFTAALLYIRWSARSQRR